MVILTCGRLRQDDHWDLKAIVSYMVRACCKEPNREEHGNGFMVGPAVWAFHSVPMQEKARPRTIA